jgi:ABC-2 type transport system ATP-binding protein/lipopolysaccharide transport system ATP-binding protein
MTAIGIRAADLCLDLPIYGGRARSLKNTLFKSARLIGGSRRIAAQVGGIIEAETTGKVVVKALDGVSFDLTNGDRVGLVGHNGAGKTTLLRVIAGILEPVAGVIEVSGAVTPMFNLTDGMDMEATGYENIWIRGQILGCSRSFIAECVDDVVEFCELGDFLNMPVRTYSAGMLVRLGFGIATALRPQILVMDEMIGAGDAAFFERARVRLTRFIEAAGILVVATHSPDIIRTWCNKAMWLSHGKLAAFGPVEEVLASYARSPG